MSSLESGSVKVKYAYKRRRKGRHCSRICAKCRGPLCVSQALSQWPSGTPLRQGPDPPPRLPLVPTPPASTLPAFPSFSSRVSPRQSGQPGTARCTLTPLSHVFSWGAKGRPAGSTVLTAGSHTLFGTSQAPTALWPCAAQEFNACLLNYIGTWKKVTCQFMNYFNASTCERILCGNKLFIFSSNALNLSPPELHFFTAITHSSALYSGFSKAAACHDC